MLGKVLVYLLDGSFQMISGLDSQSEFQMFTLFSGRHVCQSFTNMGSVLGSVNLRKTFRRISEVWENAKLGEMSSSPISNITIS